MLHLIQIFPWLLLALSWAGFVVVSRRHRRALDASGLRLQRILQAVESGTEAVGIGDFEGNSLYHNKAHRDLFGYTVDELNSIPGSGVLFADRTTARAIMDAIFAGRSWSGETDVLTKDGRRIPASVRASVIRDEQGNPVGIFGLFRDITRERQLAEEAARAGKLDSLGLMAGGIAHDFNNLLTVMLGQVLLAKMDPNLSTNVRESLESLEKVTLRARDLTQRLKAFAKGETLSKALILLPPLIREAVGLAGNFSGIRVRFDIPPGLPPVMADETQIVQVVSNLALNAVQAMPKGGDLTVAVRVLRGEEAAAEALSPGEWVRISVSDTGVGIPPENLSRIFVPFFTTKRTGTGLGLATCFSIIAKHGGHLRVDSVQRRGSTFHVYLPGSELVAPAPAPARPRSERVAEEVSGAQMAAALSSDH